MYSFCISLLHSFIKLLTVLSFSPYSLHLQFSWVLSILAFTSFLWYYFGLLLIMIQFLSLGFLFKVMLRSYCTQSLKMCFSFHFCFLDFVIPVYLSLCYYYLTPCEFFTPVLTGGFLLESKWWQVSIGIQDLEFQLILTVPWTKWFPFFLLFLVSPVSFQGFFKLFQQQELQMVPQTPSCSTVFQLSSKIQVFVYLFIYFYFSLYALLEQQNPLDDEWFSFCKWTLSLVIWLELRNLLVADTSSEFYAIHFLGQILVPGRVLSIGQLELLSFSRDYYNLLFETIQLCARCLY